MGEFTGKTVIITGAGKGIGRACAQAMAARGARVIAMARRQVQLEDARRMGAAELISTVETDDVIGAVRTLTDGRGADVVIEAVGKPEVWDLSVRLLRKGGTVNFFGGCATETQVQLDTNLLHYSELTCKASFHHTPRLIHKALQAVTRGDIRARDFVVGEEPLHKIKEVLRYLMKLSDLF